MKTSYEDIIFYLDLTKNLLKKKDIIKAIKYFISEKNKINLKGHYGLLIFQEEGNPIFIIDKKDSNIITNSIEENWKSRPREKSFFENGLFYIFSYLAETIRKKSKINRIIVISDTPSDLSEDYTDALFNLVSKIKSFPTIIDIIRLSIKNERFFKDDVKLNILVDDTNGNIFYVHDKKDFLEIFKNLVENKYFISSEKKLKDKIKINRTDYKFYSRLAKELQPTSNENTELRCFFCQEQICPVCANIYDIPLKCENCGTLFHNCCITNYAIQNNIGIPHIFRCPKCDILLKIRQDNIVEIEDEGVKSVDEYINISEESIEGEIEASQELKFVNSSKDSKNVVKMGGFFGKHYTIKKEGDKLIYQKIPKTMVSKEGLLVCPECGTSFAKTELKNNQCPYCGYKI